MTTEERLEKVEKELAAAKRQIRRLVIGGAVALVCVAILVAASLRPAQVQARKFVLVDENGKTRAMLAVDEDGPRLRLTDEDGKARAELCVVRTGPVLNLSDKNGSARAGLCVLKDGPVLDLDKGNGKTRALLAVEEGGPGIRLYGANDKIIWSAP